MFTIKPWGCEVSGQLLGCLTPKPTAALHEIRANQNHVYMFACECEMLCGGDERWHAEKMTVSHKSMPALIHFVCLCVCGVRQRREEDIIVTGCQSKTGRGFVLWKPTLCPLIFFSTLLFHFLLIPIIPPASWWGCGWSHKWGARGRGVGLGLFSVFPSTCLSKPSIPVCLSDEDLNPCGGRVCSFYQSWIEAEL